MRRIVFNDGWEYQNSRMNTWEKVTLPHDAQIADERRPDAAGGSAHAYFVGDIYKYRKNFFVPEMWEGQHIELLFEGVYKDAKIYVNGEPLTEHKYGYTPFSVSLDQVIKPGEDNLIEVFADNEKLPNSRWYTGGGIYRPVFLLIGNDVHICREGIEICTISTNPAKINVKVQCSREVEDKDVLIEIYDGTNLLEQGYGANIELELPHAKLWSDEAPYLYRAVVTLKQDGQAIDRAESQFGIRKLLYGTDGFFVNDKEVLLRGGCIHHDHGILGAACYDESEERRVRILKENGFNAIRMAHNPASRSLLEACDKYGMYVMDETFDMWFNRKNTYDYGMDFDECWKEDVEAMVHQDYNHPCVIMYSIGNELAEPITERGAKIADEMIALVHKLDDTRPVTCGVNLMVMSRAAKGNGIYNDGEQNTGAKKNAMEDDGKVKNGSLFFNMMASFIGSNMNKGGNSKKVDQLTSPFCDKLDIVGYNYGSGRYELDGTEHPERILVGTETFPQDIYDNWNMVKKYPYLIGDFMWTAWDYIGEAGIGAWSYTGGMAFNRPYPWLLAGAGVIDILGNPDMSCLYAKMVWGMENGPVIGVKPVNHPGVRVSKSTWRGTNAITSWSWQGCDGNKAEVEVYSTAFEVELWINNEKVGRKKVKRNKAIFKTTYASGKIEARALDEKGYIIGKKALVSAIGKLTIKTEWENKNFKQGDICYIDISLVGENDVVESNKDCLIQCKTKDCELLGFGSARACSKESYVTDVCTTYQGRALAVVRITGENPSVEVVNK